MGLFQKFKDLISRKKNISEQIASKNQAVVEIEQEKFDAGLKKTSSLLEQSVNEIAKKFRRLDDGLVENIEETLLLLDIGTSATQKILNAITEEIKFQNVTDPELVKQIIIDKIFVYYIQDTDVENDIVITPQKCNVILITGVNGVGKTTSIAKMAHRFKKQGLNVCLVAADTFRAGAIQQLNV
jgi:fused signal recognition particle receptor